MFGVVVVVWVIDHAVFVCVVCLCCLFGVVVVCLVVLFVVAVVCLALLLFVVAVVCLLLLFVCCCCCLLAVFLCLLLFLNDEQALFCLLISSTAHRYFEICI